MIDHSIPGTRGERGNIIEVESFTTPGLTYHVDPERGFCTCKYSQITGRCSGKHTELGKAILWCRRRRFGARIAERRIVELAHAVYRPVGWGEDYVASYELLLEALASRYATDGMKRAAIKRHGRVLAKHERRVA